VFSDASCDSASWGLDFELRFTIKIIEELRL
jgi:hypothetical protein